MSDDNAVREHIRRRIALLSEVLAAKRAADRKRSKARHFWLLTVKPEDGPEPTALPPTVEENP